jgi:hypothetical protein
MQAADFWDLDHLAKRGRLDRSADRRILFERQMRTAPSVVCKILLQGLAQPSLTEDKDVVQTLPSNGSDQALRVGVLPWIAAQSGLPEYPNISLSHKTSLHKCCPDRAANSAGHCPTGMLPKVDRLSILLWG